VLAVTYLCQFLIMEDWQLRLREEVKQAELAVEEEKKKRDTDAIQRDTTFNLAFDKLRTDLAKLS
jgi:hypothetical protein